MALIKCKECNKDISDKTTVCVHCGCPIEKELICIECGNKIDKNDNICKNCGCPNEIKQKVIKEYKELTSKEKIELKNYMKKKGVIYLPIDYVLCACAFVFAILGWFFSWVFLILVPFFLLQL